MTKEEATEYETKLKDEMRQAAAELNLEEDLGSCLVEHHIIIYCKEVGKVFNGEDIKICFQEALIAGLQGAASLSAEDVFLYIRLLVTAAVLTGCVKEGKYDALEPYVIFCLHIKDVYGKGIKDEQFFRELRGWFRQKGEKAPAAASIMKAVENLNEMGILDIEDGKIYLKECLWGKPE